MVKQITVTEYLRSRTYGTAGPVALLEPATVNTMHTTYPDWQGSYWQSGDDPEPFLVPVNVVPDWTR